MIHLTETSITRAVAMQAAREVDPLACDDIRACVKAWMASRPGIACRPWICVESARGLRVVGWRPQPPDPASANAGAYVASRAVTLRAGETMTLGGEVIAVRRKENKAHDAAEGRPDAERAYAAWLDERLMDLGEAAVIDGVAIVSRVAGKGLRKARAAGPARSKAFVEVSFPVVRAEVTLTVRDPAIVEAWLLAGVGPHKAFGYGAFVPQAGASA